MPNNPSRAYGEGDAVPEKIRYVNASAQQQTVANPAASIAGHAEGSVNTTLLNVHPKGRGIDMKLVLIIAALAIIIILFALAKIRL